MRLELTSTGFAIRRLSRLATRARVRHALACRFRAIETYWLSDDKLKYVGQFGTGGEIRTLEASLEDSNVSSYITPAEMISDFGLRI